MGSLSGFSQNNREPAIKQVLPQTLKTHREFISIPNVNTKKEDMHKNLAWVKRAFEKQRFAVRLLETATLPVFLAERIVSKKAKTLLIYLHIDGQAVNPANWDQEDPFIPVL